MDLEVVGRDDMCVMCRREYDSRKQNVFPLLNIEQQREGRELLRRQYERDGKTGPQCRSCDQLPVIT